MPWTYNSSRGNSEDPDILLKLLYPLDQVIVFLGVYTVNWGGWECLIPEF